MEEGNGFLKGAVSRLMHTLCLAPVAGRKSWTRVENLDEAEVT